MGVGCWVMGFLPTPSTQHPKPISPFAPHLVDSSVNSNPTKF
jgi:hypothetical protein